MPQEFTIRSSPQYRSLEMVLPSAQELRRQQQELTQRRGEVLRNIGQELRTAMATGHDAAILYMRPGWRERALTQAGYDLERLDATYYGPDRFLIYFGDRDADERAALAHDMRRPDGHGHTREDTYQRPSPPSPSVYAHSIFERDSPPPPLPKPQATRPPFERAQTVPGPAYSAVPARPERSVAFDEDVRGGAYQPAPGRRF